MKLQSCIAILGCLLFIGLAAPAAELKPAKIGEDADPDGLFTEPKVLRLKIELSAAAQEALKKDPRSYVKATVQEGSHKFSEVAIRLKGHGSFQGLDKKPSMTVKFNEFVPGQKFHGATKFALNNAAQDASYLCETIAGQIFREAGVPASRTTFARLELNGRDAGLYVVAEAMNKEFLARYFKKSKGNLYEGSNTDVTETLDKDSGDDATDQKDVKILAKAAQEADPAQRWKKLTPLLDLDRFITFAAAEVFVWHRDGYSLDRNNYRLYHDPASDQMIFLPHGMDQLFSKADGALWPEWKGLVARAVLETPEGKQRYHERMTRLLAGAAAPAALQERVTELAGKIRASLPANAELKTFDAAVAKLNEGIAKRVAFLVAELKKSAAAPK